MDEYRRDEIRRLADNEIRFRGQVAGWKKMQREYEIYHLTDDEARYLADLVWGATIVLPED